MSVIYDPFIILDAYWSEEQVQGFDLHLGFVHLGFWIFNLGGIYNNNNNNQLCHMGAFIVGMMGWTNQGASLN